MTPNGPLATVHQLLDRLSGRVRRLWLLGGTARVLVLAAAAVTTLYLADRSLELPVGVRGLLMALLLAAVGRQAWRRVGRPLSAGLSRLDAARLLERRDARFEGRLVSALELDAGEGAALERRVVDEAAALARDVDFTTVVTPAPARAELRRAALTWGALVALALLLDPPLDVFARRLALQDVPWPRETRLALTVPPSGPGHVIEDEGTVVIVRGGILDVDVDVDGRDPGRVELVVEGARGPRSVPMTTREAGRYTAHLTMDAGDLRLFARGGDDPGDATRVDLVVIEPPRLDAPVFTLHPPAYLGRAPATVGPEGLVVPEGTRIEVSGAPTSDAVAAALVFPDRGERVPLQILESDGELHLSGSFVAERTEALQFVLAGDRGLETQDPAHHALVVETDRPPALRVFAPSRSDIKVTGSAVVPFALIAEDDHGVESVELVVEGDDGEVRFSFAIDATVSTHRRFVLDLAATGLSGSLPYRIEAVDGRSLPGRGPQRVTVEGRRIDVVEDAEVQRLLADRQLRIKDAYESIRERQQQAFDDLELLMLDLPDVEEMDLVAAAVSQNQITTRLEREARNLATVLDDTVLNRLDTGPGGPAVLARRLEEFASAPADAVWTPGIWRTLAAEEDDGRFARLDVIGRLLDMTELALALGVDLSPRVAAELAEAREGRDRAAFERARATQAELLTTLDRLLERMDEWEDYQEVLSLVKALVDDQRQLRSRTHAVLSGEDSNQ